MNTKLDTSAIVHTALMNDNTINAYRIAVTLKEAVDPARLQKAVDRVAGRYPMICCRITEDGNWLYSQPLETITVKEDDHRILKSVNKNNIWTQATHIMYSANQIVFETFHSVADGYGAFTFLNGFVREYLAMADRDYDMPYLGLATESEMECGFTKHSQPVPAPEKIIDIKNAFVFEKLDYSLPLRFTTVRINLQQFKTMAKAHQCTLNEILLGMVYHSIFTLDNTDGKDVVLAVPINLRNKFESYSLRNFSLLAKTCLRKSPVYDSVEETVKQIRNQLHRQNNKEYLQKAIFQAKQRFDGPITGKLPLWVKNMAIKIGDSLGFDKSCMTVSNLGNLAYLLPDIHDKIMCVDTMMSPRKKSRYNCCVSTLGDSLNMTFTHSRENDPFLNAIGNWLTQNEISYTTQSH